jgi:hypothetical protein
MGGYGRGVLRLISHGGAALPLTLGFGVVPLRGTSAGIRRFIRRFDKRTIKTSAAGCNPKGLYAVAGLAAESGWRIVVKCRAWMLRSR